MSQSVTPKQSKAKAETTSILTKMAQLEALTNWFYSEDFSLDEALAKYQSATSLATEIQHDLAELHNQVEILHQDFTKD